MVPPHSEEQVPRRAPDVAAQWQAHEPVVVANGGHPPVWFSWTSGGPVVPPGAGPDGRARRECGGGLQVPGEARILAL